MKKEQIDDFTKLNVDFENFDLDIRTSDDDHYYMEYKLEKNGRKNPLTWKDKDGELTLEESAGGSGSYYITYDLGIFSTHADLTEIRLFFTFRRRHSFPKRSFSFPMEILLPIRFCVKK